MGIGLNSVFASFGDMLEERLSAGIRTTEDSVRYTFFHALLAHGEVAHSQVVQEFPHTKLQGAEVDSWIASVDEQSKPVALEFKYHRGNGKGHAMPRPLHAGQLFSDFRRLAMLDADSYSVYLIDETMTKYLRRTRNGLSEFFAMGLGDNFNVESKFLAERTKTFQNAAGEGHSYGISCNYSKQLNGNHQLRIYKVTNIAL